MSDKTTPGSLIEGRIWRSLRLGLFIPSIYFLTVDKALPAVVLLSIAMLMGWYTSFKLKNQEEESPNILVGLHLLDMMMAVATFSIVLGKHHLHVAHTSPMLIAGTVFVSIRLVGWAMYTWSVARENKRHRCGSFWSKASNLSITAAMIVWILELDNYQEITTGISILMMAASAIDYLYWYYRDSDHRKPLSVSNQLTLSRIILTPVFIWVFAYDNDLVYHNNHPVFQGLAVLMVVGFMVTDFLDGYLARKWGEVSTLGKYLDPFSDKISNMTIFFCFMASGYAPIWMVALIYFRESSVETLRTLAANQKVVMPARRSGKWKTAIQGTGILIILLFGLQPFQELIPQWAAIWEYLPKSTMGLITLVTVLSGVDYFWASRDLLKKYV
jgi:CDP-diacylglycerol--glycerol-3-phosphate 3-phosphatidyltransferase